MSLNENALRVLCQKRDELVAALAEAEAAAQARRQDLEHIDGAIKILREPKPETIAAVRRRGDLSRPLRNILKDAPEPLTAQAIVDRYMIITGAQEPPSEGDRMIVLQAVRRSLVKLRGRGLITSSPGPDNCHLWRITSSASSSDTP